MSANNVNFSILDPKYASYVGVHVVAPAFIEHAADWKFMFPNKQIRQKVLEYGIPKIIRQFTEKTKSQYVLSKSFDAYADESHETDDITKSFIGAMQIYSPKTDKGVETLSRATVFKPIIKSVLFPTLWWCIKHPLVSPMIICRLIAVVSAIPMIEQRLTTHYPRFYQLESIAIKPAARSRGYGSKMIQCAHKQILNKIGNNENDAKIPIFLFTPSPAAVQFYKKNGYKIFIAVKISSTPELTLFGMVYNNNKDTLDEIHNKLTENQEFNLQIPFMIKPEIIIIVLLLLLVLLFRYFI